VRHADTIYHVDRCPPGSSREQAVAEVAYRLVHAVLQLCVNVSQCRIAGHNGNSHRTLQSRSMHRTGCSKTRNYKGRSTPTLARADARLTAGLFMPPFTESASVAKPAESLGRSATLVAAGIFLSKLVGLLRETVFAHYFGGSDAADVFRAAVRIPNVLQNLFGEGVLSASFIPVYVRLRTRGEEEA